MSSLLIFSLAGNGASALLIINIKFEKAKTFSSAGRMRWLWTARGPRNHAYVIASLSWLLARTLIEVTDPRLITTLQQLHFKWPKPNSYKIASTGLIYVGSAPYFPALMTQRILNWTGSFEHFDFHLWHLKYQFSIHLRSIYQIARIIVSTYASVNVEIAGYEDFRSIFFLFSSPGVL